MLGRLLLRLLYVRVRPPERFYRASAEAACSTRSRIVVDVGGATGLLYQALSNTCHPQLFVILDPDVELLKAAVTGASVERIAADARHPPLRRADTVAVFHDALHHIPGWRMHASRMLEPYRCTVIEDYDASTGKGRALRAAEKLLGFPAEFATREEAERLLREAGFRVVRSEGRFPYLIVACRAAAHG